MVVRKNVLEYIIALVIVKNKVRLKKCLNKFQIWQSSIVQINLSITSLRLIPKFLNRCPRDGSRGSHPKPVAHPSARRNLFKSAPLTWNPGPALDIDLNMHIINIIADDEFKIGLYEIYFLNDYSFVKVTKKSITKNYNMNVK